jgi:hypothetical protein
VATKEAYVECLMPALAPLGEPVDLVGHEWGATLTQRVVSLRPALSTTDQCVVAKIGCWYSPAPWLLTPGVPLVVVLTAFQSKEWHTSKQALVFETTAY